MEPGKFYCYFKPSFINGFENFVEVNDINFPYLQAIDAAARDELIVNNEAVKGLKVDRVLTEKTASDLFDQVFTRSYNVSFCVNPNMR